MNETRQEDWLEARLREEAPYIDDAGFTAQVVHQLPVRHGARNSFRGLVMFAITLLACAVTYFASGGGHFVVTAFATLAAWPLWMVCTIAIFCGVTATLVAAGVALLQTREETLG